MSKRVKYRDPMICNQVARGYLSFVEDYQNNLRTQFKRAAGEQIKRHLEANPNLLTSEQSIELEPTSEIATLGQQQHALELLLFLVKTYSNGIAVNLILATEKDSTLQAALVEHIESPKTSKFFEICKERGIFEPEAVLSRTSHGENNFKHQAWQHIKALLSSFRESLDFPNKDVVLSRLTEEIDKNVKALPPKTIVEKGIDFII